MLEKLFFMPLGLNSINILNSSSLFYPCLFYFYLFILCFRHYKDLALLNLGAIFHQAKRSAEAAIVLHAALDHQPRTAEANLMLANVYVVLGDYNRYYFEFSKPLIPIGTVL